MGLYLVEHTHTAEKCPAKDPQMVRKLASHITPANAQNYGVKILADWVNDIEHRAVLVLETDSEDKAAKFARPFLKFGELKVSLGITCAEVAAACLGK
ncbi:MAG TPA: DUF3303 family protein [Verrucomicrobiae bacterium]|nr:DUF3303 family protein [Verrucomicrobiae bacterium]